MKQREMSYVLCALDVLSVVACLALVFVAVPGMEADSLVPKGFTWLFAAGIILPLGVAVLAWMVFRDIGRDASFTTRNAWRLRVMGYLAMADALLWLCALLFVALSGALELLLVTILVAAFVFALIIAVVCAALSHLTAKAAAIETENDLVV